MKNFLKIIGFLFVFSVFTSCDFSDEETVVSKVTKAQYTYVREQPSNKITFINTSENADSYTWDFGDGTTSTVKDPVKTFTVTGNYVVTLTVKYSKTGVTSSYSSTINVFVFQGGLILNGDFESGTSPWTLGVVNAIPAGLLVTANGNTYFSIPVNAVGNPFDVNLSQKGLNLTQGITYRLTFDAWSDVNRSMIVGIGLSGAPFTNQSVSRNITPTIQNFSIDLVANFTNTNSRVLFDIGAAIGRVNIDNVTLNPLP